MSIFQQMAGMLGGDDELSDALYTLVAAEMSQGKIIKPLWTKALAHCDFEPTRTQAFYVRERVARLQKNIKEIRQYAITAKRLQEAINRYEADTGNLHRMKKELPALEKVIETKRKQLNKEEQEVRQKLHAQFSPEVGKNKLYTWLGTAAVVALLISAYFLGFLNSGELYLALFLTISLVALVQLLWWQPLDNKVAEELRALENQYNIGADAEAIKRLSSDIPRLELQIHANDRDSLQNSLMELEFKLSPLFQYDSINN